MIGKNEKVTEQIPLLLTQGPKLYCLLQVADAYSQDVFGEELILTSLYRNYNDPYGLHEGWRACDIRIFHENRGSLDYGLSLECAEELADFLNHRFQYKRSDGSESYVAHIVGEGLDKHVHLQVSKGSIWGSKENT